jgi:hypothetical protein
MSEAPKPSETIKVNSIHTTEMTLETRVKNINPIQRPHIQVSTEFLGGRFDTKG